ncbi:MAG: DHA2 family efflux MFS transporter permease subunit [Chthoniobacterales bacterium]|nr:DHA2 family efflux MFS transporter permease subunit [Chthoniobacterales bacterium]
MNRSPGPGVPLRSWIALWGAMLGAFMAVLDIQITNSSLPEILGSLGSTLDEGSWIQTSYLVSEIIVIPMTAWLASVFGTRRYMLVNTALFLVFSVGCAFAQSLNGLIVFRVLQGFTGGALIPMAFTLVLRLLPPGAHPLGFGLFGMTATFAPAVGPTVGGWLTDNMGWPAIFYLNLIPGAIMMVTLAWGLEGEKPRLDLLRTGNWWGIGTMALGLGSLIIFLEEGNRNEWFSSRMITTLGFTAALALTAAFTIEWRNPRPLVNLRLLTRRNFGLGALVGMAFGFAMYGAAYLLPLYLARVQGYSAQQIGWTIMWSGAPQLLMMPVAALLLRRVDARLLLAAGLGFFGASCFVNATLTNLTAYDQLKVAQLLRAVGMPLTIVPLTALATGGIEQDQSGSASALFNMLRNLGGSIGIALLATQLDWREKFHSVRIGENVSIFAKATEERLAGLTQYFMGLGADPLRANDQAVAAIAGIVRREAFVMSFADCFFIVGVVMTAMIAAAFLCRPSGSAGAPAH